MFENKFYKIAHTGGTYVVAVFWNPITGETKSECVRDYDYADGSHDNDELYDMPIDEEACRAWEHSKGVILEGDTVEVVKGRKVKIGTVAKVTKLVDYHDCYGRKVCKYAYLDNGERTNIDNCKLVKGA